MADIALWLKYDSSFMTYLVDYVGLDVEYKKIGDTINKDQLKPALSGALFSFSEEGLNFVSTDGHRLVVVEKKNESICLMLSLFRKKNIDKE